MAEKARIDKWLWSVRIFKSRTIANTACRTGKVRINKVLVKASQQVATGDVIRVSKNGFNFSFKALKIIQKRVSAPLAQECYENVTPEEEINKYKNWFIGKGGPEKRDKGMGRPTKKERRTIDEFKFDWLNTAFEDDDA